MLGLSYELVQGLQVESSVSQPAMTQSAGWRAPN